MRRSVVTLFASALLLAWAHGAAAQTPCEDALRDAEKSYELGLFEDVPGKLSPCLGNPTTRSVAIHVHSLLARAYLNNEEPEQARKEISTLLRLQTNYEAEAGSSGRFVALVAKVRREEQTTQVASVSKTNESLREAPATVVVVTADEIQRRGYLDLEQIFHDLPGFDISRLNGADYSAVYQRGYNSAENNRALLLVDGVEQNDLSGGSAYFSREYPISNIDRVEVIYGPASTMYGANAYTGVINIVTREPESLADENKRFGLIGEVTTGQYGNRSLDIDAGGRDRSGTIAWSVAGNFQESKARDLTNLDDWDYTYRNFDYKSFMRLSGTPAERAALCAQPSPYIHCSAAGIELTDQGEQLVRGLDQAFIQNNHLGWDDRAKNWSVYGKLRISNLTIGLQSWRSQEGIASAYGAVNQIGGSTFWTPRETALYVKYTLPLNSMKLNFFSRFEETTLERSATEFDYFHDYASGSLSLWSLIPPCASPNDPQPVGCAPALPWVEKATFGGVSSQLRSELSLAWEPSETLNGVTGFEFVKSSIQSQYDSAVTGKGFLDEPLPPAAEIEHTDAALYTQGSWKPRRSLRFVAAGRLSYNTIDNKPGAAGYGALFSPRLGVIYSPGERHLVLKAIYSEAFKDATDNEKFGITRHENAYASNGLRPERVRNAELSAGWELAGRGSVDASLYQAHYKNIVAFGYPRLPDGSLVPDCQQDCLQFQNRDEILIRGLETTARYKLGIADLWANYTHVDPRQIHPNDDFGDPLKNDGVSVRSLRVADIAANRVNLGIDADWRDRLSGDLRFHYVGKRKTGEGTTNSSSPFNQMDPYVTADAALSLLNVLHNATLQLVVNNVLNKNYYDGGSIDTISRVLQAGRTINLRLIYRSGKEGSGRN